MLRVALTGGVGSGKSAAGAMLRELGAHVSQSDEVGRAMMQPGEPVFHAIREHFGTVVMAANGELDRAALADIAFRQGRVEELNAIVHPAVIDAQERWMNSVGAKNPGAVAIVESALVFETRYSPSPKVETLLTDTAAPWRTRFDRIVVVTTPAELRRDRYLRRASWQSVAVAAADFEHRAAAQWSDTQKAALADFVVPNGGSLDELRDRVEVLYLNLRQEAADSIQEAM